MRILYELSMTDKKNPYRVCTMIVQKSCHFSAVITQSPQAFYGNRSTCGFRVDSVKRLYDILATCPPNTVRFLHDQKIHT